MEGKRKFLAWLIASALLTSVAIVGVIVAKEQIFDIVKYYLISEGSITAGFFGFNFGEHMAKAIGAKNGK